MKLTPVLFLLCLFPMQGLAQSAIELVKTTVKDAVGPPGNPIKEKTQVVAVNETSDVTFIFLCSAGKEDGSGDFAVNAMFGALTSATGGIPLLVQKPVKKLLEMTVVNKGDAFCSAIAFKTGTTKKANNVSNGSIYTTAWDGAKKLGVETDDKACGRIHNRYLCFEVVENASDNEVEGVSGCFEAEIDEVVVSYSFGRGELIPEDVANTFNADASRSDKSCEERGLGLN